MVLERRAIAELGSTLRARTVDIEAARTLPADVVALLTDAGIFRLWLPKELDGAELRGVEGADAIRELSAHDAATGWCAMIAMTTSLLAARLPVEHARTIFGPADAVAGGNGSPEGRARSVEGGLLVSGRWQWGSGLRHATMFGGGVRIVDADGKTEARPDGLRTPFVFFDPSDVTFIDNWQVLGLGGTGSSDYEVHQVFVPEGRWAQVVGAYPRIDRPLYRVPFYGLLAAGVAAVAIGIGERAIEEFVDLAVTRVPTGSRKPLAHRAAAQTDVAHAEATVASARALLYEALAAVEDSALREGDPRLEDRRRLRLAAAHAGQRCADAVALLHRRAGGEVVFDRSRLQRAFRDAHVASQHAMVTDRLHELTGRLRLGLEADVRTL